MGARATARRSFSRRRSTEPPDMMGGRTAAVETADGAQISTYVAGESGPPRPALILFTPIFGVDGDMTACANAWASDGFLVAAPDYFCRVDAGPGGRDDNGRARAMVRWKALEVDRA